MYSQSTNFTRFFFFFFSTGVSHRLQLFPVDLGPTFWAPLPLNKILTGYAESVENNKESHQNGAEFDITSGTNITEL